MDDLETFLSSYSPAVRLLVMSARSLILEALPSVIEQIDAPSRLLAYGTGPKYADTICTLMPLKNGVNLGIYRAVELPDPHGLLSGTGKLHRHVALKTEADIQSPALRELLAAAAARPK